MAVLAITLRPLPARRGSAGGTDQRPLRPSADPRGAVPRRTVGNRRRRCTALRDRAVDQPAPPAPLGRLGLGHRWRGLPALRRDELLHAHRDVLQHRRRNHAQVVSRCCHTAHHLPGMGGPRDLRGPHSCRETPHNAHHAVEGRRGEVPTSPPSGRIDRPPRPSYNVDRRRPAVSFYQEEYAARGRSRATPDSHAVGAGGQFDTCPEVDRSRPRRTDLRGRGRGRGRGRCDLRFQGPGTGSNHRPSIFCRKVHPG